MLAFNEQINAMRTQCNLFIEALPCCQNQKDLEAPVKNLLNVLVPIAFPDHYAEIVSAKMPQDDEERKDGALEDIAIFKNLVTQLRAETLTQ